MRNKTAVQYHFGSKNVLIEAIVINRMEEITRRRKPLEARLPAITLRSVAEAQLLPVIELAEDENCFHVSFLEHLIHSGGLTHRLDRVPGAHLDSQRAYSDRVGALIDHVPQPLCDVRVYHWSAFCVRICTDRHRARQMGMTVPAYAVHVRAARWCIRSAQHAGLGRNFCCTG